MHFNLFLFGVMKKILIQTSLWKLMKKQKKKKRKKVGEDYLFNYRRSKLAFGLILFEMDDAIKEGDGRRLHDLYKFALLIYRHTGRQSMHMLFFYTL